MKTEYLEELIKLSYKAAKHNEVPVSALIVKNNKIIARAYNSRHHKKNVCNHAEIICIKKASKKLKDWRLNNCELYVTLKPCSMCTEIIKQSRINKVYYIVEKNVNKKEYNRTEIAKANIRMYEERYTQVLQSFFQNKRDKKQHL